MAQTMNVIRKSVGLGGANDSSDIVIVQRLLNDNRLWFLRYLRPLPSDGIAGDITRLFKRLLPIREDGRYAPELVTAIEEFQRQVLGAANPDGRVDKDGRTIKALYFVQLPNPGAGYYHYAGGQVCQTSEHLWGTPSTIESVKAVARRTHGETGVEIGIGHISYRDGRPRPPSVSHRIGIDVDIRPLRTDGAREAVHVGDAKYSRDRTAVLVKHLRKDPNLSHILFNDTQIEGVQSCPGHDNHLHVRFRK